MDIGKCKNCGREFKPTRRKKLFCERLCSVTYLGKNNINRKLSDETKSKIGRSVSGEKNGFFGKTHTENSILLARETRKTNYYKNAKYANLSDECLSIINGLLISDGSLTKSRYSSRLTFGFKFRETNERIIRDLSLFNISINYINRVDKKDNRTGNEYCSYFSKSLSYANLMELRNKWYPFGKKRIPEDIKFTSIFLYWWFICDGFKKGKGICFCTESFENDDLEFLRKKFNQIGIKCTIHRNNRIYLDQKNKEIFYRIILENNIEIQNEYVYKFS